MKIADNKSNGNKAVKVEDTDDLGVIAEPVLERLVPVVPSKESAAAEGVILLVDDEVHILKALNRVLRRSPWRVVNAMGAREALSILGREKIDVVVMDYYMPEINGLRLARMVRERHPGVIRIMLTGCIEFDVVDEAAQRGEIFRYLVKPWEEEELLRTMALAVKIGKELPGLVADAVVTGGAGAYFSPVTGSNLQAICPQCLKSMPAWAEKLMELARTVETRDPYTLGHSSRVARLAVWMGEKLGLGPEEMQDLELGSLLHDIGKISIPDSILFKPAALPPEDRKVIEQHPVTGEEMLIKQQSPLTIRAIVRHHHENFEGSGYPDRLSGEAIPFLARIVRLADTFDAMYHRRPYRDGMALQKIKNEIQAHSGRNFAPELTPLFLDLLTEHSAELDQPV